MSERVALITGGSRGLGYVTARKLAAVGFEVVLTARKAAEAEAAAAQIRQQVPGSQVRGLSLDLTSSASIRGCASSFQALGLPLHVLVNNAGLMTTDTRPVMTAEGFELTLATNHLGHFLLTHLLLGDLERAAPSRVVVVSSAMHRKGVGPGPGPDFDYDNLKAEKGFHPMVAYRNSKLANLWFAFELDRCLRGKNVAVLAVSPGWVPETQADQQASGFQRFLFRHVLPRLPIARTVEQGADNTVFVATEPSLQTQGGGFFEDRRPGVTSDEARTEQQAKRLWDASCAWCGISKYGAPDRSAGAA